MLSAVAEPGLYVNAGGGAIYDGLARNAVAGTGFTGGHDALAPAGDVADTFDDTLFRQHRAGQSFTFAASVPNGDYLLFLEFSEPSLAAGERLFDVTAEGAVVLDDFDIAAVAGGAMKATATAHEVTIADGQLNLSFTGENGGEAIISAIVLAPTDIPPVAQPYELTPPGEAGDVALEIQSASHLRQIGQAVLQFANDNPRSGYFPPDLQTLLRQTYLDADTLANPRTDTAWPRALLTGMEDQAWGETLDDYIYIGGGLRFTTSPATPVAYDNPDRVAGRINVLRADGSVIGMDRADAAALLGFEDVPPTDGPPPRDQPPAKDPLIEEVQADLRKIGQRLREWTWGHDGRYPDSIGVLAEWNAIAPQDVVSPRTDTAVPADWSTFTPEQRRAWVDANSDYAYNAAGRSEYRTVAEDVLAFEDPDKIVRGTTDGMAVLMAFGNAEFLETPWTNQLIDASAPLAVRAITYAHDAVQPELHIAVNRLARTAINTPGQELIVRELDVTHLDTGQPVDSLAFARYDDTTQTAIFRFADAPNGVPADGNYRATVPALGIMSGNEFSRQPASRDFFVLAGDANRDRTVSLGDFLVLRRHFGQSGRVFSEGDFNYDGVVSLADFLILRGNFGQSVQPSPVASLFARGNAKDDAGDRFGSGSGSERGGGGGLAPLTQAARRRDGSRGF